MFSNKIKAIKAFKIYSLLWVISLFAYLFFVTVHPENSDFTHQEKLIYVVGIGSLILIFFFLLLNIKIISIDITGMGFNFTVQPVIYSFIGNFFKKNYQINPTKVHRLYVQYNYIKKIVFIINTHHNATEKIFIGLSFFTEKDIRNFEMELLRNKFLNTYEKIYD